MTIPKGKCVFLTYLLTYLFIYLLQLSGKNPETIVKSP